MVKKKGKKKKLTAEEIFETGEKKIMKKMKDVEKDLMKKTGIK